jgi:hypothetical protein
MSGPRSNELRESPLLADAPAGKGDALNSSVRQGSAPYGDANRVEDNCFPIANLPGEVQKTG